MKKRLVGIILILAMVTSFSMVAFADFDSFSPASIPICIDVDIQE